MRTSGEAVVTAARSARRVPWRSGMGYALYAALAFGVFLVWLFPVERLQTRLLEEIERRARATVTVRERDWVYPLGMVWQGVTIAPIDRPDRATVLDVLRVRIAVLPLLRGQVDADLTWEAYGGKARGSWSLRREADGARISLDQFGQGFDVGRLPGLPDGGWQGLLQVDLNGRWLNESWWLGEGAGSVEVTGLKVGRVMVGGFPISGIEFESVAGHMVLNGGTITLQRLTGHGPLGKVSGDGTVLVRAPWTESVINLTLKIEPAPGAADRVPLLALAGSGVVTVRVSGRLAHPGVSVNGAPVV